MWKNQRKPNPPAPFPEREGGEIKASLLAALVVWREVFHKP